MGIDTCIYVKQEMGKSQTCATPCRAAVVFCHAANGALKVPHIALPSAEGTTALVMSEARGNTGLGLPGRLARA